MSAEVVEKAKKIVQEADHGHLATAEGDQPRVRPLSMTWVGERELWFATHADSRKVDQIKGDAAVEVSFVDAQGSHVRLAGRASTTQDSADRQKLLKLMPGLAGYFDGPTDSKYLLVKIAIDRIEYMGAGMLDYATHEF
jgi:general stress protein 26